MQFESREIDLLLEALGIAASRLEALGRITKGDQTRYTLEDKAHAMRRLHGFSLMQVIQNEQ